MSKITNPLTEPSVTCGFYNGANRTYNATQMSSIFDGIIKDGIFQTIGTYFAVQAASGTTVNVGTGKCWFNHTWTENDAILPIDCGESELILNRYDAIVIEVNSDILVNDNFIKVVHGSPASSPSKPTMIHTDTVNQYALCYIYRAAESTEITQSDITNAIGTDETPFVSGILETVSLDVLLGQWQDQLNRFVASEKAEVDAFMAEEKGELSDFLDARKAEYDEWYEQMVTLMQNAILETNLWTASQKNTILDWFQNMKNQLSTDAAANLQIQIDEKTIENWLLNGLSDGIKTFSDDGLIITTVDSSGRKLVKTFTNNSLTITSVLTDSNGGELGRLVKDISSDAKTITSEITIH